MNKPIPPIMQSVAWEIVDPPADTSSGLPYPTHSGVLDLGGLKLKCHRLSSGESIIEEDSMREFLKMFELEDLLPPRK